MTLGYFDAKRFLYGLAGRIYYIDAPGSEPYYFDKMMSELELLKIYVEEDLDQETRESLKGYRMFTETLFPRMAVEFKLKDDWNYRDLYRDSGGLGKAAEDQPFSDLYGGPPDRKNNDEAALS